MSGFEFVNMANYGLKNKKYIMDLLPDKKRWGTYLVWVLGKKEEE